MTTTTAGQRPVLLLVTLTVLMLLVAAVRSGPFDYVNVTRLTAVADDFRRHWSTARSGQVKIWLQPDGVPSSWSDDNATTVCGYKFVASTDDPNAVETCHLPTTATFRCNGLDKYRVHLAASGGRYDDNAFTGEYDAIVSLDAGARVYNVRLGTAGVTAVPLTYLCFGFLGDDGGLRAFCADVDLLTACRRMNESPDLDFGSAHVQLGARRRYSCREIVFSDVHALVHNFEALASHGDDEAAQSAVCERIGFVSSEDQQLEGCLGQLVVDEHAASDSTERSRQFAFISPDRFADVEDIYGRCERLNDDTGSAKHANAAEVGGGPQTSSGQRILSSFGGLLFLLFSGFSLFIHTHSSPL